MNQATTKPAASTGLPATGFVRIKALIGGPAPIVPVSRATFWRMVKDGRFPKPVKLSTGFAAWRSETVTEWINSREQQR